VVYKRTEIFNDNILKNIFKYFLINYVKYFPSYFFVDKKLNNNNNNNNIDLLKI